MTSMDGEVPLFASPEDLARYLASQEAAEKAFRNLAEPLLSAGSQPSEAVRASLLAMARAAGLARPTAEALIREWLVRVALRPDSHRTVLADPFTGMELVAVPGGTFEMGDLWGDGDPRERPVHSVTVSAFLLGRHPVTQGEWEWVMGTNPSRFKGPQRPVESVSWEDCQVFLRRLGEKTGRRFRLPTEAEWEYAARSGGKQEKWAGTSDEGRVEECAWCGKSGGHETHPVGQKQPNGLGLFDMSGNVWEWTQDWQAKYPSDHQLDPRGPPSGVLRVMRGGCWFLDAAYARCASRDKAKPDSPLDYVGFRVAADPTGS